MEDEEEEEEEEGEEKEEHDDSMCCEENSKYSELFWRNNETMKTIWRISSFSTSH
jgi:hypothetical protein